MKRLLIFIVMCFVAVHSFAQQKRLYIADDNHTDYMWTADEAAYDTAFVKMLDYYLAQIDSTRNDPADYQSRFNCDGSLWLKAYQQQRSAAQFNRLIAAIKSGHISSPLNMLVSCFGGQPTEAVLRGMYYAGKLERQYNLRFTMAGSMENNTLPLGLASLWAGSGAKYSWKGIGGYGSQMSYDMRAKRKHPMYHYNGLDNTGVLMKWYPYNEKTTGSFGGYAECRVHMQYKDINKDFAQVVDLLDGFCDTISNTTAYPYNIAGAFGFGHDDLDTYLAKEYITAAKNGTTPARKIRVSNEEDFFKDFEKTYTGLPSQSVTYGNEWDLLPASMNEPTAKVRRSVEKLRTAEALASIVSLTDKTFGYDLAQARDNAWQSLGMYWEHNWTADGPVSRKARADWQVRQQQLLGTYVDTLFDRSLQTLGSQLCRGTQPSFYVFNALSWMRSDVTDLLYDGPYPIKVMDRATGKEVRSQWVEKSGKKYLRILVENIPSVGYKIFDLKNGLPAIMPAGVKMDGHYISNAFYRLRMNRSGAITEWYDSLGNGRQLVKLTDGKYLNDLGGSDSGNDLVVENAGPVSVTIKAVSTSPILHTVRLTMYAHNNRVEIEDSIQQNFGEVTSWAFSFNVPEPTTHHEELGTVITSKKQSRGGHYAEENARYDWQTFNHFANVGNNNYGVNLSNLDCSFFKLGNSSPDSLWEGSAQLNALAGGNIDKKVEDGGTLGILKQNGNKDFLYHFALSTQQGKFDPVKSMRFSMEHQNPLVAAMITGNPTATPATTFSLLKINDPNVLLWSIKPAEDGVDKGLITRFWNMATTPAQPMLQNSRPIKSAWKTSHIETDELRMKPIGKTLKLQIKPLQMNTYRLAY